MVSVTVCLALAESVPASVVCLTDTDKYIINEALCPLSKQTAVAPCRVRPTVSVWHSQDRMQLDMNDWAVSARYEHEHKLCFAAGGRVDCVLTGCSSSCPGNGGSLGKAERGTGNVDAERPEYCLLSHGSGLRSHWRTAVLFQNHLLKVQTAGPWYEIHI